MRYPFISIIVLLFFRSSAQPFLDLGSIRYAKSPDAGIIRRDKQPVKFDYLNSNLNLPLIFKKDSSAIVFSPSAEEWYMRLNNAPFLPDHFQSLVLQVSYLKPLSQKWLMTVSLISRWNGYNNKWFDNNFQQGGAFLFTYKKTQTLKYKFGLYYNSEFQGPYFVPLFGIDWRINSRNSLFGVLPGNMTLEHKAGNRFYYGIFYKSITNTYRSGVLNGKSYFTRIADNQLSVFSDVYLTKRIVFTAEAGHSILRRLKLGYKDGPGKYFYTDKTNDDWLFKTSFAYRIRL